MAGPRRVALSLQIKGFPAAGLRHPFGQVRRCAGRGNLSIPQRLKWGGWSHGRPEGNSSFLRFPPGGGGTANVSNRCPRRARFGRTGGTGARSRKTIIYHHVSGGIGRMRRHTFNPVRDRTAAVEKLLTARAGGETVRRSADAANVDKATVCRWLVLSSVFAAAMRLAEVAARDRRRLARPGRPWVACHPGCPKCGGEVEVRSRRGSWSVRFWACDQCPWKSWRPRHPRDCPKCRGPRFWSHSRRTVLCPACPRRWTANPEDVKPIPADQVTRPPARPMPTATELLARAVAEMTPAPPRDPDPMWVQYQRMFG